MEPETIIIPENALNIEYYFYYIIVGVMLTGMLSAYLYWQGGKFLMDAFQKDESFAKRANAMLLVAFILINLGYIFLTANPNVELVNRTHLFQKLIFNIGVLIAVLALEHLASLVGLYIIRQRRKNKGGSSNADLPLFNRTPPMSQETEEYESYE
jgi:hypothetical protein